MEAIRTVSPMLFVGPSICLVIALSLTSCTLSLPSVILFHSAPPPPRWFLPPCASSHPYTHILSIKGHSEGVKFPKETLPDCPLESDPFIRGRLGKNQKWFNQP